ncbi:MAG TPA: hypothetical protein VEA17_08350 [Bordetella sp.]|nr:hypothetical protein [Bordetella sp.]
MTESDLDLAYTQLAQALTRVGDAQAPLFLSALCLSLISRQDAAAPVLALIEQAEQALQA